MTSPDPSRREVTPKVSIITLNWNGLQDTVECLESLKKISYPNYEVIVVDNGSEGNDVQVLQEKFGGYVHLIENDRNYGFAEGNNIGIRYALDNSPPDYFLLLNNDTVVDAEFLGEMVKVAETDPAAGIVGGKIYSYDQPAQLQFVWGKIDLWRGRAIQTPRIVAETIKDVELDKGQYDQTKEVDWVTGSCFLIKKQVTERIGLLDSSYFCYWEDAEYCIRAKKAGYSVVYVPAAKVWHKGGRAANKVSGLSRYYWTRNRFWFLRKHATRWQYLCFLLYFFGVYVWLATGYYLVLCRKPKVFASFCRGARDGVCASEASAKLYRVA